MAEALEILLPQITSDDFTRSWTHFELVASAKKWEEDKQLAVVPTLLRGKLIDYFLDLTDEEKKDLESLKAALQEKAGLKADPLTSFKLFNERTQRHDEKAGDFASELKKLFKQAFPGEDYAKSPVLLQRYLTGLRPNISRQILLRKQPESFQKAITDATEVELALSFGTSMEGQGSETRVNAVTVTPHPPEDSLVRLQQTLESVNKRLELLESKFVDADAGKQAHRRVTLPTEDQDELTAVSCVEM